MIIQRRPWLLLAAMGLSLTVFVSQSHADEAQIGHKSKGLAHYIMAVVDDLNGDTDKAIAEYKLSAKFDRHQVLPHLRLAAYYTRLGNLKEAQKQLKIAIQLQPDSTEAHYLLALIYSSEKKYTLATTEYESILKTTSEKNPQDIEIHAYLSQLYYAAHKYPQAIEQLNAILKVQPNNVSTMYLLGTIYCDLGEPQKAKENFKKILAVEPENDEALNSLAYMYAEEGTNLDEALKMARKAVDIDPSSGAYYDTLGWVLFKQGLNAEGLMAFQKALNYLKDPIIYDHIGDVYKAVNELALARQNWLKSLSMDPKQPKVSAKLEELNHSSAKIPSHNSTK